MNEFGNIFAQQLRKTKQIIADDTIENVKMASFSEFDEEESLVIRDLLKKLLRISKEKNDSNEVGMLVDFHDWKETLVFGDENRISLRECFETREKLLRVPRKSLAFFHNHPKNTCFSEKDLESFFMAETLYMIAVIGNNGKQYYLIKTNKYSKDEAMAYYDYLFDNKKNCVKEFLRTCRKVGLKFIHGG